SRTESRLRRTTFAYKIGHARCFTSQRKRQDECRGEASRSESSLRRCTRCSNRRCQPTPQARHRQVQKCSHHTEIAADPARLRLLHGSDAPGQTEPGICRREYDDPCRRAAPGRPASPDVPAPAGYDHPASRDVPACPFPAWPPRGTVLDRASDPVFLIACPALMAWPLPGGVASLPPAAQACLPAASRPARRQMPHLRLAPRESLDSKTLKLA